MGCFLYVQIDENKSPTPGWESVKKGAMRRNGSR